jgi:hypothetical protein
MPAPTDAEGWLALIASLPTEEPAARMRIVRTLEAMGSGVIREGAYLMPDTEGNRQGLESLAEYIHKAGGNAQVLRVLPMSEAQQQALRGLFDRSGRYTELVKVIDSLKVGFGMADPGSLSRVLNKQRRELEAISALDFFPSAPQARAQQALGEAEAAVSKLLFPSSKRQPDEAREQLHRRTWATRRSPWADRLACAWLIRRFLDPEGNLFWLDKTQDCPEGMVGFAFDGAQFGNSSDKITFEVMLEKFGRQNDSALVKIGSIVHFLEIRDTPVPEAAGVQTLLQGAQRRATSDEQLLEETEKTFDLLYEAYFETPRK